MRFEIEQHFAAPATDVMRAYSQPELYGHLEGLSRIGRPQVLDVTTENDGAFVRLRYRFIADLPAAALTVIDRDKLTWVDETRYDFPACRASTVLRPDHYADRLSSSATSHFEVGPGDSGSVRRIRGEVKVRMAFVGGKVEGAIVEGLREHCAEESRVVDAYLQAP